VTLRSIKSRVSKLERSRKRTDEILVVWRRPGADVSEAVADVDYVSAIAWSALSGMVMARLQLPDGTRTYDLA
jgi:hypothetical protein